MKTQARGDKRRADILAVIRGRWMDARYPPTVREIANEIGASPATVHRHLRLLRDQGLIEYRSGVSRSARPIQPLREDRDAPTIRNGR